MTLALTNLSGFGSESAGVRAVEFGGSASSSTGATSFSFTSTPIGTPSATRYVVVCVTANCAAGGAVLSSVTVAGTACTQIVISGSGATNTLAIYRTNSAITTGTTATVAVTFDKSTDNGCAIATYAINPVSSTATETKTSTTDAANMNFTLTNGGIAIACGTHTGSSSFAVTGATEDLDTTYGSGTARTFAAANASVNSASYDISFDVAASPSTFRQIGAGWV